MSLELESEISGELEQQDVLWFHGLLTRDDAEEILKQDGEEGTFLVRASTSCIGEYALSIFTNGDILHIQICRHDNDAFFSLEDHLVIHGLDELIKYYQSEKNNCSTIQLRKPLLNSPPPAECRLHGRTNLLHRATKEGSIKVVTELVRCGYRSLDAKNETGQTAIHLASIYGYNEILSILIESTGTGVNVKDSANCTPLHYACLNNHPIATEILLAKGNANPQLRRNNDGWVPLHESSFRGYNSCIHMLLKHNAPLRPRTLDNKLPIDLAIEANNFETVNLLDNFQILKARSKRTDWYHSHLERQEALSLLHQCQKFKNDSQKSYYLVRRSVKSPKVFVLTLLWQGHTFNFEIGRKGNFFFIDNGPYLDSLEHVVDHYSLWSDGLPVNLQISVNPMQSFNNHTIPRRPQDSSQTPPPLPRRIPISHSPIEFAQRVNGGEFDVNSSFDFLSNNSALAENIPSDWIEIGSALGEGEYGEVFEGKLTIPHLSIQFNVAVKTVKEEMKEWAKQEFLQEAKNMMDLQHEHIVRIFGICWTPQIYMVQELLLLGSLQDYLVSHREDISVDRQMPKWANQIAKGMVYLQEKRFVHRDLAARNILLSDREIAKISDFGLSRALGYDSNYYRASKGGRWPIKWYAPESCNRGTFSHASDVWSYGVTLWEMYSFGETPYGNLQGKDVLDMIEKGIRLERPEDCPIAVYQIMKKCWEENPEKRPIFQFFVDFFSS